MKQKKDEKFTSIRHIQEGFKKVGYITSRQTATTVYLAHHLEKPILVEGPAGVGKTELAKTIAAYLDLPMIRLQCYEGLDESKALYEWKTENKQTTRDLSILRNYAYNKGIKSIYYIRTFTDDGEEVGANQCESCVI